jgi:hypothetical protein
MTKQQKIQTTTVFHAYWAGSASQSLIDAYRRGDVKVIRVTEKKG